MTARTPSPCQSCLPACAELTTFLLISHMSPGWRGPCSLADIWPLLLFRPDQVQAGSPLHAPAPSFSPDSSSPPALSPGLCPLHPRLSTDFCPAHPIRSLSWRGVCPLSPDGHEVPQGTEGDSGGTCGEADTEGFKTRMRLLLKGKLHMSSKFKCHPEVSSEAPPPTARQLLSLLAAPLGKVPVCPCRIL